jgi:pantetheine-phosphate adenylyltransferase
LKVFVYPGSFDPVTKGHLDIIERALKLCDKLIVAVLINNNKKSFFSIDERVEMLKSTLKNVENIEITYFTGLLVDFVKIKQATAIIKGLRVVSDFEYEFQMALLNKNLAPDVETLFIMTSINYSFLSSSSVRELASYGASIDNLVPDVIKEKVIKKFKTYDK